MPTYDYRCTECGLELEVFQRMNDERLTHCPECDGALTRVIGLPMIMGDIEPFTSIVNGETISGRAQLRNHLAEYGLEQVGNEMSARQKRYKESEFEQKLDWHKERGKPIPDESVTDTWSKDG